MNIFPRKTLTFVILLGALLVTVGAIFAGGYYYVEPTLPRAEQLRDVRLQIPLRVYSRDGRLIAQFGEQKRTPVPYEAIPERLIQAVLAAEDDAFFEHPGLDFVATARASFNFLTTGSGERVPGGSTITQQVAREYFLTRGYSLVRKFKEWILAFRIESEFSKEEILELYLNTTFFGQSSYGVFAAAQTYFDKQLDELSLSDVAIIAGIPQGPSIMNPFNSAENAAARRAYVLRRMRELNLIDTREYESALAEPVRSRRYGSQAELEAPYVAEMVRAELIRRFGPAAYTAGLKVTTTLDSRLQRAANDAVRRTLIDYDERHGYRGPIRSLDWSTDEPLPDDESRWQEILADYADPVHLETALVLAVEAESATVYLRNRGYQNIGLPAVEWAAPYLNENVVGAKPESIAAVLSPGDIVRLRTLDDGTLRLAQLPEVQGALVALDPQDGAVAALVGGFDFYLSNYNRATQSRRQPGSAFKPFVYSAALENGFTTASVINDAPVIENSTDLEGVWKPENYEGQWHGPTRLREAMVRSLNSVAVRVILEAGVPSTVRHMRNFGFDEVALPRNASLALGAGGIAPADLVRGYAILANGGFSIDRYFIQRIETDDGEVLYSASPRVACAVCEMQADAAAAAPQPQAGLVADATQLFPDIRRAERVVSAQNVYLITDMMRDVIRRGSGNRAQRELGRRDLAGKTGTTNGPSDAWFAGFNADIVATAWVGFDDADRLLGRREQGGVTAIPIWNGFMAEALKGIPERLLERPPGIVDVRINPDNGLAASDLSTNAVFEKFRIGHVPEREADPVFSAPLDQFSQGDETREQVRPGAKIF